MAVAGRVAHFARTPCWAHAGCKGPHRAVVVAFQPRSPSRASVAVTNKSQEVIHWVKVSLHPLHNSDSCRGLVVEFQPALAHCRVVQAVDQRGPRAWLGSDDGIFRHPVGELWQ